MATQTGKVLPTDNACLLATPEILAAAEDVKVSAATFWSMIPTGGNISSFMFDVIYTPKAKSCVTLAADYTVGDGTLTLELDNIGVIGAGHIAHLVNGSDRTQTQVASVDYTTGEVVLSNSGQGTLGVTYPAGTVICLAGVAAPHCQSYGHCSFETSDRYRNWVQKHTGCFEWCLDRNCVSDVLNRGKDYYLTQALEKHLREIDTGLFLNRPRPWSDDGNSLGMSPDTAITAGLDHVIYDQGGFNQAASGNLADDMKAMFQELQLRGASADMQYVIFGNCASIQQLKIDTLDNPSVTYTTEITSCGEVNIGLNTSQFCHLGLNAVFVEDNNICTNDLYIVPMSKTRKMFGCNPGTVNGNTVAPNITMEKDFSRSTPDCEHYVIKTYFATYFEDPCLFGKIELEGTNCGSGLCGSAMGDPVDCEATSPFAIADVKEAEGK